MWEPDCDGAGRALNEKGAWTYDGAVSDQVAADARAELLAAHQAGLLRQSGNRLAVRGQDGRREAVAQDKPNVFEADVIVDGVVERQDVLDKCPVLAVLLRAESELRDLLNAEKPDLVLDRLEQAKVQVNTGNGGAFPHHFDLSTAKDARRHLTALLYLNPDWREGSGGEVEVLLFPFDDERVAPLNRRLLVFSSSMTMHRVRPFTDTERPRVCVNLWFEGKASLPFPTPLPAEDFDSKALKIVQVLRRQPNELRAFCKLWYREAIAESFREAFRPSAELDGAIELHYAEAKEIETRIAPAMLRLLDECIPLKRSAPEAPEEMVGLFEDL